jgi:dipeptidyl aminopeptidase/acylaminoacyl peptidase
MRLARWFVLAFLTLLPLGGCGGLSLSSRAEAVDVNPPAAQRLSTAPRVRGRIAYVSAGQVWEWADGATRPLTPGGQHLEGASWSPDGRSIAVSDVGENHSDVLVLDARGTRLRQLTRNWSNVSVQDSAWGRKPAWSPEGDRIAYVTDLGRNDMSLWVVPAGGGQARALYRLGVGSGGLDWPSWSPDGKKIAFTSYPPGVYQPPQVFVLTLATGAVAQLTEIKAGAFDPAWSPDGSQLAFTARIDGKTSILVMKADGTSVLQVSSGRLDRAPAWSPEGSELAYLAHGAGGYDVWAIRLQGTAASEPKQLTSGKVADAISGLSWTQ